MTVAEIQRALLARDYDLGPGGADDDAGPRTIAAMTAFQRSAGLVPDGIAGPLTIKALGSVDLHRAPRRARAARVARTGGARGRNEGGIEKANNPIVVRYFADAGFSGVKDDVTSWCAAFVGAMLQRAGHKPSGSLAARSYEGWGVGLKDPALGCIATKKRAGSSWQGHVGIVVGASASTIYLLDGNQGDAVSIAGFKRSEFTSFRWPADVPLPVATKLPTTIAGAKSGVSEA
ncbi:TIGR02594 family protein [Methylobacterium sp. EM32]|uniref:NlpC/P60 family protein n=1 Tax=Methylobacterium sp. EM32 TaxID=3163481 RepID=UPI0033B06649